VDKVNQYNSEFGQLCKVLEYAQKVVNPNNILMEQAQYNQEKDVYVHSIEVANGPDLTRMDVGRALIE